MMNEVGPQREYCFFATNLQAMWMEKRGNKSILFYITDELNLYARADLSNNDDGTIVELMQIIIQQI